MTASGLSRSGPLALTLAIVAAVALAGTVPFGMLSVAFGIAGTGGIIPVAWIVAAIVNLIPLVAAVGGMVIGVRTRDTGVGVAAIVIGALATVSSLIAVVSFVVFGLANPP